MAKRKNATKDDRSTAVPAAMQDTFTTMTALTDQVCKQHLNKHYADLARKALATLCRKRPSPLTRGRTDVWACAVVYALGQVNFLSDRSQKPHMAPEELCRLFGVASSTAMNKAKMVREMLGMSTFDHRWMLPDRAETFAPIWMASINGLIADIRSMPRAVQEQAFQRGMIPYIPDDRKPPHPRQKERDKLYASYDRLRRINTEHQSEIGAQLLADGMIDPIAQRLGLMDADGKVFVEDNDDDVIACLAPALDLALYTPSADGTNAVTRYAEERQTLLTSEERRVLEAMGAARFSVFRIERKHETAGTWLSDTIHGGEIWLMDRGLEASGGIGMLLGLRVFRAADFWMSTGVLVPTGMTIARGNAEPTSKVKEQKTPAIDSNQLAEEMYRGAFGAAA